MVRHALVFVAALKVGPTVYANLDNMSMLDGTSLASRQIGLYTLVRPALVFVAATKVEPTVYANLGGITAMTTLYTDTLEYNVTTTARDFSCDSLAPSRRFCPLG